MFRHDGHYGEAYSVIFCTLYNTCIFTTVSYSEPSHIQNSRHLQKPVKHVKITNIFSYSGIFRTQLIPILVMTAYASIFKQIWRTLKYHSSITRCAERTILNVQLIYANVLHWTDSGFWHILNSIFIFKHIQHVRNRVIFRTLAYLHVKITNIYSEHQFRTVYSGIFKHIYRHSGMLIHIQ